MRCIGVVLFIMVTSCGILAPYKQRDIASNNIAKAQRIKAEQYSGEAYKKAKTLLAQAEEAFVTNKKSPANQKAKDLIEEANTLAIKAYSNSIKPYTIDIVKETDLALEKSKENKVDITFKADHEKLEQLQNDAKDFLAKGEYHQSLEATLKANNETKALIEKTLELKELSKAAYTERETELVNSKQQKVHIAMKNNFKDIQEKMIEVKKMIDRGYYHTSTNELAGLAEKILMLIEETKIIREASLKIYGEALSNFHKVTNTQTNVTEVIRHTLIQSKTQEADASKEDLEDAE